MRIRHTHPEMAGEKVVAPNGHLFQLDAQGEASVPDDCGIHLAGPEWVVTAGKPRTVIVERNGSVELREPDGPLLIISGGPEAAGQLITAPNGTVLRFNDKGYAAAADNCGILSVPGYQSVEPANAAVLAAYRVELPTTLEAMRAAVPVYVDLSDDEDENPYAALAEKLAGLQVTLAGNDATETADDAGFADEDDAEGDAEGEAGKEAAPEKPVEPPAKTVDPARSERAKKAHAERAQRQSKKAEALAAAASAAGE